MQCQYMLQLMCWQNKAKIYALDFQIIQSGTMPLQKPISSSMLVVTLVLNLILITFMMHQVKISAELRRNINLKTGQSVDNATGVAQFQCYLVKILVLSLSQTYHFICQTLVVIQIFLRKEGHLRIQMDLNMDTPVL